MKILITNDDGVYYPGILALARILKQRHDVFLVAPRMEQSGISQAITFLRPIFPVPLAKDHVVSGYSVDGTPTDCIKLALEHLCPFRPDLVISGMNGGLNVGVNCCYSGTVGGALAATQFGLPAMAISLQWADAMDFERAAELAVPLVEQMYVEPWPQQVALNINFSTESLSGDSSVHVVPMETNPLGYKYDEGRDAKGRLFYWANNQPDPDPSPFPTDVSVLKRGQISATPLSFNLNHTDSISVFSDAVQSQSAN